MIKGFIVYLLQFGFTASQLCLQPLFSFKKSHLGFTAGNPSFPYYIHAGSLRWASQKPNAFHFTLLLSSGVMNSKNILQSPTGFATFLFAEQCAFFVPPCTAQVNIRTLGVNATVHIITWTTSTHMHFMKVLNGTFHCTE
ncbi:unnamed protein product [Ixodes hexagonus]